MRVIGDKNQISEDVFDFMISNLTYPQKLIRSGLAKLFSISILEVVHSSHQPFFRLYLSFILSIGPNLKVTEFVFF